MTLITDIASLGTAPLFEGGATPEEDLLRLTGSGIVNALAGDDTVLGPSQSVSAMFGAEGNDTIRSQASGDSLFGGNGQFGADDGNDFLTNNTGLAVFFGEGGNDTIEADRTSTVSGGLGNDYIVTEDLSNLIWGDQPAGIGGDNNLGGNDTIILGIGATADGLNNAGGDDSVSAGPGNDYIRAGAEQPSFLFGNMGNDTITQFPGQVIRLENLGDTILALINTAQPDTAWGGQGNDYILGTSGAGFWALGDVGMDTIVNLGSQTSNFVLAGDVDPNATDANSADYIRTGGGNQHFVFGNIGNDTIDISYKIDNSTVLGGQNQDRIVGVGTAAEANTNLNNFVSGDRGSDYIFGAFGNSTLWGDNMAVNDGNDTIILQGAGTDVIGNVLNGDPATSIGTDLDTTTSGDDTIISPTGGGDDVLVAMGAGRNTLIGGAGDDSLVSMPNPANTIVAGSGNRLDGGLGDDTYVFSAFDTLVADTNGNNVYIGKPGAAKSVFITLQATDTFSGEGQFTVTGDQNNFLTAGNAGIRTGNGRDQIVQNYVLGTTSTAGGDDVLDLQFVGSLPDCPGLVMAGSGNDSIRVDDIVNTNGTVDAGIGNDTILALGSGVGGAIIGGDGDDYLRADAVLPGGVVSGGDGNDTYSIGRLDGGGLLSDGNGDDRIVPDALGTTGGVATITGGDGGDTLGLSTMTGAGSNSPALSLDGGNGNDFLQGASTDVLTGTNLGVADNIDMLSGGNGNDTLFGGDDRVGDMLNGGVGDDVFIIFGTDATGFGVGTFNNNGSNPITLPESTAMVIGSDGAMMDVLPGGSSGLSPFGTDLDDVFAVINKELVDTLTGFTANAAANMGDTIVLNQMQFAPFAVGAGTRMDGMDFLGTLNVVSGGFLAGAMGNGGGGGTAGSAAIVLSGSGFFNTEFAADGAGTGLLSGGSNSVGLVTYNSTTGGLYVDNGTFSVLTAVLDTGLSLPTDPNSFMDVRDPFAGAGFVVI